MKALRMKSDSQRRRASSTGSRRRRARTSTVIAPREEVALRGAHDLDRRVVEVGEQLAVDDVADRAVVRVAVEQVDRAVEHRQQRVQIVDDDEDRDAALASQTSPSSSTISCWLRTSRFASGSSSSSSSGSPTSACAMATRCCWPPDSCDSRRSGDVDGRDRASRAASTRRSFVARPASRDPTGCRSGRGSRDRGSGSPSPTSAV